MKNRAHATYPEIIFPAKYNKICTCSANHTDVCSLELQPRCFDDNRTRGFEDSKPAWRNTINAEIQKKLGCQERNVGMFRSPCNNKLIKHGGRTKRENLSHLGTPTKGKHQNLQHYNIRLQQIVPSPNTYVDQHNNGSYCGFKLHSSTPTRP